MLPLIKRTIMKGARRLFASRGYDICKVTPLDYRDQDVLSAVYEPLLPRPVLVNVPIEHCRSLYWFSLQQEKHPFVATLLAYGEGRCHSYEGSPMERFYELFRPECARDILGIPDAEAPGFSETTPLGFCLPWQTGEPVQNIKNRQQIWREEAEEHGAEFEAISGSIGFGPTTPEKGRFEFMRLVSVYDSIKEKGYHRHDEEDGDLGGKLFLHTDMSWCVRIWQGHHRVAALAALGYDKLPIRIRHTPIRASEIDLWPQVRKGKISRQGALTVFNRILQAQPPEICQWPARAKTFNSNHRSEQLVRS